MIELDRHRLYHIADRLRDHLHGPALSTPTAEAVTALLADLTRPAVRTRAMAFIGVSIGLCFIVSLLGAPVLAARKPSTNARTAQAKPVNVGARKPAANKPRRAARTERGRHTLS